MWVNSYDNEFLFYVFQFSLWQIIIKMAHSFYHFPNIYVYKVKIVHI